VNIKKRGLLVSNKSHIDGEIPSGPIVCTKNYINLLEKCKIDIEILTTSPKLSRVEKLKNKIVKRPYRKYDNENIYQKVSSKIEKDEIEILILNQVNLTKIGAEVKKRLEKNVKVIVLSHGNESGDELHEAVRRVRKKGTSIAKAADATQLGWMLLEEAQMFTEAVDLMLCMSEIEEHINAWLGASESMVVPRIFEPSFLDRSPVQGRVGFVGSLKHLPNTEGIRRVLTALESEDIPESLDIRIVGGPPEEGSHLETSFDTVTYCGRLPQEDFKSEAATWGLFLNPIWWYARGATTKLAQAIEWGIPAVTTKPGMRGYTWSKGNIPVADTPEAMARLIIQTTEEPSILTEWAEDVRTVAKNGPSVADLATELSSHLRHIQ
jgi:hypothetical protein